MKFDTAQPLLFARLRTQSLVEMPWVTQHGLLKTAGWCALCARGAVGRTSLA